MSASSDTLHLYAEFNRLRLQAMSRFEKRELGWSEMTRAEVLFAEIDGALARHATASARAGIERLKEIANAKS